MLKVTLSRKCYNRSQRGESLPYGREWVSEEWTGTTNEHIVELMQELQEARVGLGDGKESKEETSTIKEKLNNSSGVNKQMWKK